MDVYNLNRMWGAMALRGFISILFGAAAVFWPGETLVTLAYLFGAYVLISGLVNEAVGLSGIGAAAGSFYGRVVLVLLGFAETGVGVYLLRHPHVVFSTLILLIGLLLIVRALVELFVAIFGDAMFSNRMVVGVSGLAAAVVGVIMLFQPEKSGIAFVWLLGAYALVTGPMLVALAYDAKAVGSRARR